MTRINLTVDHLKRMKLPKRFWNASFDNILPDDSEHKTVIRNYLSTLDNQLKNGHGLFLWGNNGTGKTSCAAVIAKEAMRREYLVLFIRSTRLRDGIISRDGFDDGNSLYDRIKLVDLLIIDDLGKEYSKETGSYNEKLFEDVIRMRIDDLKSTIVTSNMSVNSLKEQYKESMIKLMKGYYIATEVKGHDHISDVAKKIRESIVSK